MRRGDSAALCHGRLPPRSRAPSPRTTARRHYKLARQFLSFLIARSTVHTATSDTVDMATRARATILLLLAAVLFAAAAAASGEDRRRETSLRRCLQRCEQDRPPYERARCVQECKDQQQQQQERRREHGGHDDDRRDRDRRGEGSSEEEDEGRERGSRRRPYVFGRRSFRQVVRSDQGSVRLLPPFHQASSLLRGIKNYRVAVLEANPRSFVMPTHTDAHCICYVAQGTRARRHAPHGAARLIR
mgnify:CR=1 FL=1